MKREAVKVIAGLVCCGVDYDTAKKMPFAEAGIFFDEVVKLKNPKAGSGKVYKAR